MASRQYDLKVSGSPSQISNVACNGAPNASAFSFLVKISMGILSGNVPPEWHPASAELRAACERAAEHCRAKRTDLATLAVQFAVANPDIATTLIGMGDTAQVTHNLAAVSKPLDTELLTEVAAILATVHNQGWQVGRPENR